MATLQYGTYPVTKPFNWDSYGDVLEVVTSTSTKAVYYATPLEVNGGVVQITFTGKNFTYSDGAPTGGQVSGWKVEGLLAGGGKELAGSLSGLKAPFTTAWDYGPTESMFAGNDKLYGANSQNETLSGFAGNDTLDGKGGDDFLEGGAGKDKLIGGSGIDGLLGGEGADTLTGGAGADLFFFSLGDSPAGKSSRDTITDFKPGEGDKIYIYGNSAGWTGGKGVFQFDFDGNGIYESEIAIKGVNDLSFDDVALFS